MAMSQEFQFGLNLIRRFEQQLRSIAEAKSKEEARPTVESIKHPIFGAMAQIKAGEGPLKEEILEPLAVVVSQFRETTDFDALKEAIREVLNLAEQIERLEAEGANKEA